MKKHIGLSIFLFFMVFFAFSQSKVIYHQNYTISFNEKYKQPDYVFYTLTSEETQRKYPRTNRFTYDPLITSVSTNYKDSYFRSGYDRGHLAPAGDMSSTYVSVVESFYYTNMSPQRPKFNRGVWKDLEAKVRQWAVECDSVLIVTGPILKEGLKTIGKDSIAIPELFYKIVVDARTCDRAIAFLIPNRKQTKRIKRFVVSIDSIESITGIDFFPSLQNEDLERNVNTDDWNWTKNNKPIWNVNNLF